MSSPTPFKPSPPPAAGCKSRFSAWAPVVNVLFLLAAYALASCLDAFASEPNDHPAAHQAKSDLTLGWGWAVAAAAVFFGAIALSEWMPLGFAG